MSPTQVYSRHVKSRHVFSRSPKRLGTTIVEALLVVALGAVVIGMSVRLIQLAMSLNRDAHASFDSQHTLDQLESQLRRDLRRATVCWEDGNQSLPLDIRTFSGEEIQYRRDGTSLVRQEMSAPIKTERPFLIHGLFRITVNHEAEAGQFVASLHRNDRIARRIAVSTTICDRHEFEQQAP